MSCLDYFASLFELVSCNPMTNQIMRITMFPNTMAASQVGGLSLDSYLFRRIPKTKVYVWPIKSLH